MPSKKDLTEQEIHLSIVLLDILNILKAELQ